MNPIFNKDKAKSIYLIVCLGFLWWWFLVFVWGFFGFVFLCVCVYVGVSVSAQCQQQQSKADRQTCAVLRKPQTFSGSISAKINWTYSQPFLRLPASFARSDKLPGIFLPSINHCITKPQCILINFLVPYFHSVSNCSC